MKISLLTLLLLLVPLISQQVRAQVQTTAPGLEPNPSVDHNSRRPPREVILVAIISALLFVSFYFIYLCCCIDDHFVQIGNWSGWRHPWGSTLAASLRRHSFKSTQNELDPEVVKSFPTFEYGAIRSSMLGKDTLECSVCLTEYNDKDVLRLIPKCDHVFHADCVDDWLIGHATCPVCRLNLANVNFWDDLDQNNVVLEEGSESPRIRSFSSSSQQPRLFGGLSRSFSTGHVAIKRWEDNDRYTLRLPWEVRKQIMSRSGKFGNDKVDRRGKSDSWVFSLTPSFRKHLNKFEDVSATSTSKEGSFTIDVVSVDDEPLHLPV